MTFALHAKGPGFDSQSEQIILMDFHVCLPEWSKGSRLGRDVFVRVGSNPTADNKTNKQHNYLIFICLIKIKNFYTIPHNQL